MGGKCMSEENNETKHGHLLKKLNEMKRLVDDCIASIIDIDPSNYTLQEKAKPVSFEKLDFKVNYPAAELRGILKPAKT